MSLCARLVLMVEVCQVLRYVRLMAVQYCAMMGLSFEWRCRIQRFKMFWARKLLSRRSRCMVEASRLTQLLSIIELFKEHVKSQDT